ncbi:putative pentatricopeptide repeat-containing protein [Acorus calamus]|uniref:Pentatricopeptide repeat-containing protein n=1 Tax=Acorus calamus TaxID=4465 RepID=A0AAV9F913_ACOCL|nr:putative pentatricopeptide repeat-containing protein [Acorus calamus]
MLHGFRLLRRPPPIHHHHHHLRLSITTVDHLDLLLHRCQTPKQSPQIHAQIILSGLRHSPFHAASLVSLYSRHGRLSTAISTFRSIPTVYSNTLLWNCILRAHLSHARPNEALRLYLEMRARGVPPDAFTFPLITRAASSCIGDRALCCVIHAHAIVSGFGFRLHAGNELVAMYGRIGELGIACEMFDGMSVRTVESWNTLMSAHALGRDFRGADELFGKMVSGGGAPRPNPVTWTSLLSAHARGGREVEVLRLFDEMRARCEESPTAESVGVVLSVCADLGEVDYGRGVHGIVVKMGFEDYVFVRNSIVCVYGRVREAGDAERVFSEIREKSLVSWNGLISSYASAGLCWEAFEAFTRLEREGGVLQPNVVS